MEIYAIFFSLTKFHLCKCTDDIRHYLNIVWNTSIFMLAFEDDLYVVWCQERNPNKMLTLIEIVIQHFDEYAWSNNYSERSAPKRATIIWIIKKIIIFCNGEWTGEKKEHRNKLDNRISTHMHTHSHGHKMENWKWKMTIYIISLLLCYGNVSVSNLCSVRIQTVHRLA